MKIIKLKRVYLTRQINKLILAAKAANPQADASALEAQIDKMVYKLYDLSESEIETAEVKS
jgi:hypothetical protein